METDIIPEIDITPETDIKPRTRKGKEKMETDIIPERQKSASKQKAQYSPKKTGKLNWPPNISQAFRAFLQDIHIWAKSEEIPPHIADNRIKFVTKKMENSLNPEEQLVHEIILF